MDTYSCLMNIDEVIEYLSDKTDRNFNKDKTIKLIEDKKIPIVFQYQGWGTYEFNHERKYQSLNIEVDGYFRFRNASDGIHIFKGFLTEIAIHEAIIYHLNSYRIRGNAPDGIEPRKGDDILFKTGGRSPVFIHPNTQSFIKIDNNKAGVLKVDLEKYLNKMQINYVDNKTKIETLESEIKRLKSENATLVQQHTETLIAANAKIKQQEQYINSLNDQLSKPADSVIQSNTDMQNLKKVAIKQFNRSLATALIKLDYQGRLRKHDIANYIMPYMKELAFVLADEQADKADNLNVTYDTLYDTHLQGLGFKKGRQSNDEKEKVNIDLLFKKQLPITK